MEQVREGKIDCILVKDFSRFARDYIELGSYLEQIFPFLGVRFLSFNDGYDSAKENGGELGLQSAFQNLLYDWYSKDLSIKVKTSLKAKKENGVYISSCLPYGYQRDPVNRCGIKIWKEEADIVCTIFSLALQGKSSYEIARIFNQKMIPTRTKRALWRAGSIDQILKNPFYIGSMVYGKYEKRTVGGKSRKKAREEWKEVLNHHEAVIEREIFEEIQRRYKGKREKREEKKEVPFTGMLVCASCRNRLQRRATKSPYFTCTTRYITDTKTCVKQLEEDKISRILRELIWKMILSCQIQEEINRFQSNYEKQKIKQLQEKIQKTEAERRQLSQKGGMEYRKYEMGWTKKEEYLERKHRIQSRERELMLLQEDCNKKLIFFQEMRQEKREVILICKDFTEIFMKKIVVSDREKLVIYWTFSFDK